MLLIMFANWRPCRRDVIIFVLPVWSNHVFKKCIFLTDFQLKHKCLTDDFFDKATFSSHLKIIAGDFNVVAQQRLFCKPSGERFWLGSPNPPPSSHWCPYNTLKTHNASCLFVPGLLLRTHPICVNWIPSCPSYVCGGPPWKSLLEVWSESRRSLYNRPWSAAKVHWRRLDINATVAVSPPPLNGFHIILWQISL